MKIALYGGIVLAIPFILYSSDSSFSGTEKHERVFFLRAFNDCGGALFAVSRSCYFFIPDITLPGMAQFNTWMHLETDIGEPRNISVFVIMFMLGMGVSFEIPVLLLTLVKKSV